MKRLVLLAFSSIILIAGVQAQYEAPDPSRNIPNARVLAMGRAYMGLSDDTAAIFTNPAGMANIPNWEFTSMSGKLMDEYSYLSFSGLYPTEFGTVGLGYMNSSVAGAWSTIKDPNSSDDDPIYIIDNSQPPINYFNNVTILSYANKLSSFLRRFGWEDNVSLGTNLKLFSSGLSGDGITAGQGTGSGLEIDLGILSKTSWPWLQAGITLQNLLPSTMGGKLRYASGHEESYPVLLEPGLAVNLLGEKDSLYKYGTQKAKLLIDYYLHPTLSLPGTAHIGIEYQPIPMVAVRAGIDQDISGNGLGTGVGTISDLTAGVGLYFGGFRFDYAYHQFAGVPEISNNYFSLTYGLAPLAITNPIKVSQPPDKLITFNSSAELEAQIIHPDIKYVKMDVASPRVSLRGNFSAPFEFKEGKNTIQLTGLNESKKEIFEMKVRVLKLKVFPDVAPDYWVAQPISLLAMQKIISGYPDGTFRPNGNITRDEMCTLLMKASADNRIPSAQLKFNDVSPNHWAAPFIAQAAELGIVKGYPDGGFRPKDLITRVEGIAMISRFAGIREQAYTDQFMDLSAAHWSAKIVAGAYQAGILKYLEGKPLISNRFLSRAEVVEMLQRTDYVKSLLQKDLLNWDSY